MSYIYSPTPSAHQRVAQANYASNLNNLVLKEMVDAQIVDRFSEYNGGSIFKHLELIGATQRIVNNRDFRHGEKPRIFQSLGVNAVGAAIPGAGTTFVGGAGGKLSIQLLSTDHVNGGTALSSTIARVGDHIEVAGKRVARITFIDTGVAATSRLPAGVAPGDYNGTTSNHVLVVVPLKLTTNLAAPALAASSRFRIFTNSQPERSDSRDSIIGDLIEWQGSLQNIRETMTLSGSALTEVGWVEVPYLNGKGYVWYNNAIMDQYIRMLVQIEDAVIFGQRRTNTDADIADINAMGGYIDEVKAGGYEHLYSSGFWGMSDWNIINKYIIRNGGAPEYLVYSGLDWRTEAVQKLQEQFSDGAVIYGSFMQNAETTKVYGQTGSEVALKLGFNSLSMNGITFHFRNYEGYDHPERAGLDSLNYSGDAMLMPMDKRNIYRNGGTTPSLERSIEIAYSGAEGYNRTLQHWVHGGAFLAPEARTSGKDEVNYEWLAEAGIWGKAWNRHMIITRN